MAPFDPEAFAEHQPLVEKCAKMAHRFLSVEAQRGVDLDDLIGSGAIGLLTGLESFDPGDGIELVVHLQQCIGRAIRESVSALDWLPRSVRDAFSRQGMRAPAMTAISTFAGDTDANPEEIIGTPGWNCHDGSEDQDALDAAIDAEMAQGRTLCRI